MSYVVQVPSNLVNQAEAALLASFGQRITVSTGSSFGVTMGGDSSSATSLYIDSTDTSITADSISTVLTNALGQYTAVQGSTGAQAGSPGTGLNLGNFLNSIGAWIRAHLPGMPSFSWLWWVFAAVIVILFAVLFTTSFSKGLGEGVAARA